MDLGQLTIVLPTRNEEHNIKAFLDSVPPAISLVVVDESQDATRDLIRRLRPDALVLHSHLGSVTRARQCGAEAATTDWLLFTDADVVFDSAYFQRLGEAHDCDLLYGPKLSQDSYRRYYRSFAKGQEWLSRLGIPAASGSNMVLRRSTFVACGGFDLRLSCNEDSELGWRVRRFGAAVRFDAALIVWARDHRRLAEGKLHKTAHTLARCALLYTNLMPGPWRSRDWGYWDAAREREAQPQRSGNPAE